jgi:hypothetical protein
MKLWNEIFNYEFGGRKEENKHDCRLAEIASIGNLRASGVKQIAYLGFCKALYYR